MKTSIKQLNNVAVSRNSEEWPERWIWKWDGVFSQFPAPGCIFLSDTFEGSRWWMLAVVTPLPERRGNWNWDGIVAASFDEVFQWLDQRMGDAGWEELRRDQALQEQLDRLWHSTKSPPQQISIQDPLRLMVAGLLGPLYPETASMLGAADLVTSHTFSYTSTAQALPFDASGAGRWLMDADRLKRAYERSVFLRKLTGVRRTEAVQMIEQWIRDNETPDAIHVALAIQAESMEDLPAELLQDSEKVGAGFDLARQIAPRFLAWVQKHRDPEGFLQKPERLRKLHLSKIDPNLVISLLGPSLRKAIAATPDLRNWWLQGNFADAIPPEDLWTILKMDEAQNSAGPFVQYLEKNKQKLSMAFLFDHLPIWTQEKLNSYTLLVTLSEEPMKSIATALQQPDATIRWMLEESKTRDAVARFLTQAANPDAYLTRLKQFTMYEQLWKKAAEEINKSEKKNSSTIMQHAPESAKSEPQFVSSIYMSGDREKRITEIQKAIQKKQLPEFMRTLQGEGLIDACRILVGENLVDAAEFRDQVFLNVYRASAQTATALCDVLWQAAEGEGLQNDAEFWIPIGAKIKDLRADLPEAMLHRGLFPLMAALQQRRGDDVFSLLENASVSKPEEETTLQIFSAFAKRSVLHLGSAVACMFRLQPQADAKKVEGMLKPLLEKCSEQCNCLSGSKPFIEWFAPRMGSTQDAVINAYRYPDFVRGLTGTPQRGLFFNQLLADFAKLEASEPQMLLAWEEKLSTVKIPFERDLVEWASREMEGKPRAQNRQTLRMVRRICLNPERTGLSPKELRKLFSQNSLRNSAGFVSAASFHAACAIESALRRMEDSLELPVSSGQQLQTRFSDSLQLIRESPAAISIVMSVSLALLILSFRFLPEGIFLALFVFTAGLSFYFLES